MAAILWIRVSNIIIYHYRRKGERQSVWVKGGEGKMGRWGERRREIFKVFLRLTLSLHPLLPILPPFTSKKPLFAEKLSQKAFLFSFFLDNETSRFSVKFFTTLTFSATLAAAYDYYLIIISVAIWFRDFEVAAMRTQQYRYRLLG